MLDGIESVFLDELPELLLDRAQMADAVAQKDGAKHGDIGSGEEQLGGIGAAMNPTCRGEARVEAPVEHGDPAQRKPELAGRAKIQIGNHAQRGEVDIRLVEAIEENEPVGAMPCHPPGKTPEVGEKRPAP